MQSRCSCCFSFLFSLAFNLSSFLVAHRGLNLPCFSLFKFCSCALVEVLTICYCWITAQAS